MYWIILFGIALSLLPMMAFSAYSQKKENRIHQFVQKKKAADEKPNLLIKE